MPTIVKAFKYRLYPTPAQEEQFRMFAGCRRYVWNWALARKQAVYKETGKSIGYLELCRELTQLKKTPEASFLAQTNTSMLQQTLRDLDRAFAAFFDKRARFPRFKSKKRSLHAFRFPSDAYITGQSVRLPNIGNVRAIIHREPEGVLKSATVKQDSCGAWYVVFMAHVETPELPVTCSAPVGIDTGLESFATLSSGEKVAPPRFYRKAEAKMKRLQRRLSRAKAGSKRRAKSKARLARHQARTANQRRDWLHKLSARIVSEHDTICVEDLNLRGLAKTKRLSKSFSDASIGEFIRQLTYKSSWGGGQVVKVGRFYSSTKICHECGHKQELTLKERAWTCAGCQSRHDRDMNAAKNLLREGLRIVAGRNPETLNAQGADVRPAKAGGRRKTAKAEGTENRAPSTV